MAEILLSSENFIKSVTSVSDNLSGKYLLPSLREAQEVCLRGIIGESLLNKIKTLIANGEIETYEDGSYKVLVDHCQYYLAYQTIVEVIPKVSYKIGNFGTSKTSDDNLQLATYDEIAKTQYFWQGKADACCLDLQNWLLDHRESYPELSESKCNQIRANLESAVTNGIFLGGARGRRLCK